MPAEWNSTVLANVDHAANVLTELRGKRWLSRGQPKPYGGLHPSMDRKRKKLTRTRMLTLERQSIDLFRSTARFFAASGEALSAKDDLVALMVMRHYGVPTRLLDWSLSPFVSAYFVCGDDDATDGEIWSFDYDLYLMKGSEQWKKWPETTSDGSGTPEKFNAYLTAFTVAEPRDWFICSLSPRRSRTNYE